MDGGNGRRTIVNILNIINCILKNGQDDKIYVYFTTIKILKNETTLMYLENGLVTRTR